MFLIVSDGSPHKIRQGEWRFCACIWEGKKLEQMTLFENQTPQPLASRLRPQSLDEYVGQEHLLGRGKVLRRLIESDQVSSMIFWPVFPGTGQGHLQ